MAETKFTPGPWVFDDNDGYNCGSIWARMAPSGHGHAGPLIARAVGDSAEVEANAHLIAAAPEMYEALKEAVEYFEMAAEFVRSKRDKKAMQYRAYECRVTLAKADGKS